jgi:hypothetical protein
MYLENTEARIDCAGEDQQQFNRPIDQTYSVENVRIFGALSNVRDVTSP